MNPPGPAAGSDPLKKPYIRAVGPRLRIVLFIILGLVAVLGANSAYLLSIRLLERLTGLAYQNYFYQYMFLAHLVLGLLMMIPFIIFGLAHMRIAWGRPNRRAVRVGLTLFITSLVLLFSGVALMRVGGIAIKNPGVRSVVYWAHVITPLLAVWLYLLHRLAGPRIKWRVGLGWATVSGVAVVGMVIMHLQDPRKWNVEGPKEGARYFYPSLARTASGNFIPARDLMLDDYCLQCHPDTYHRWYHSAHHFSSFNNPPYLFSVRETRRVALKRDGNVRAARWCAGCHDVVPFFSGAFDNPHYDDVHDPSSQAGVTCVACHSIVHINSTRGNADYTIQQPIFYPFTFSKNRILQFINRVLVKANPEFHKRTFLKPLHRTAEFCSTCHKVDIPYAVSHYKQFLRGQDHYDAYLLSGVSGHGARSFYYPPTAATNCAACHMPLMASDDFGARFFNPTNHVLSVHDHFFPGANTGIAYLKHQAQAIKDEQTFLKGVMRVDIFGIKDGGAVTSPLVAPLRPRVPALKPGHRYLIEIVNRTLKVGHLLTQGTADSNEVWNRVRVTSGGRFIGCNGGLGPFRNVDRWSHFLNLYMLDRHGNRIDRRNPQDIFTPLYNHQIPPGAGQVVHYAFTVPPDQWAPITIDVELLYRKFDTIYMNYVYGTDYTNGAPFTVTNNLPITTLAEDRITFPVDGGSPSAIHNPASAIPDWERWNDYGIGLLLEGNSGSDKGELVQAEHAFTEVEKLGHPDGPVNLARVYLKEGRLGDAVAVLDRAARFNPPARRWTVAWLNGEVNKQNGFLDDAIEDFRSILEDRYPELDRRHFDFSRDYIVINELGQTLFERARRERGPAHQARRNHFLQLAAQQFERTLTIDSENATAHYNLALIYAELGETKLADEHRALHERYRPDDNARDRAIVFARRENPAADHAAESIVIYPLQRPGAPELGAAARGRGSQSRPSNGTRGAKARADSGAGRAERVAYPAAGAEAGPGPGLGGLDPTQ